jgi:peptide/nickel transport system substrate-binding protein
MKKLVLFNIMVMLVVMSIVSFGEAYEPSQWGPAILNWGSNVKYGGTVKAELGIQAYLPNLNPFITGQLGVEQAIYEPLFYINGYTGQIQDMLGTSYKWQNNNLKLVVTTREGVKWSDGVPFTAADVAFTFNLLKKYPALDGSGIWSNISNLQSVEASGTNTVIFTFSKPNTPLFYYIAGTMIVPEHIWSKVSDPTKFNNMDNPVGTGPFLLQSVNSNTNSVVLVKNPNYWMTGRPYVDKVVCQGYLSNTTAMLALLKGDIEWGGIYIPDVNKTWVAKDPSNNEFFWPALSTNNLYLNTQKYPFDNVTFRKAIDLAINKPALEQAAYFGIGGVANMASIIPGQISEWFDPTLTEEASALNAYNPSEAQKLLASIGFTKDSAGNLVGPNGQPLPTYKILVGAGWTDFITMADILSENLKAVGINTIVDQETWNTYISTIMTGGYDMAICWLTGTGPTPYYTYYQEFNPTFSATKLGASVISDYSRYTNPLITAALSIYSQTSDTNLQKQAMYTIERIFIQELPYIPLNNRTNFAEWSSKNFVGWPSESNPYAANGSGVVNQTDGEITLLNIHLK